MNRRSFIQGVTAVLGLLAVPIKALASPKKVVVPPIPEEGAWCLCSVESHIDKEGNHSVQHSYRWVPIYKESTPSYRCMSKEEIQGALEFTKSIYPSCSDVSVVCIP